MCAFFYNVILLLAESGGHATSGGFTEFYNNYLNYPGFEAWKFVNLAIFIGILVYLVKRPLGDAFKAKREAIRSELIKAEEEKQAALAQLLSAEAKLASLGMEKESLVKKAKEEAEAEKSHIAQQTEGEIEKMREQATGEINRLAQQVKAELRRFSAKVRPALEGAVVQLHPLDGSGAATAIRSDLELVPGLLDAVQDRLNRGPQARP